MRAYSFERGFEELWDAAYRSLPNTILLSPLLMLWRQSIELHIKSAIYYTSEKPKNITGHDLESLFSELIDIRRKENYQEDKKNSYIFERHNQRSPKIRQRRGSIPLSQESKW